MNDQEREILTQFSKTRSSLIPILQRFQDSEKYISPDLISEIGAYLDLSENDIYSVADFYPRFKLNAPGEHNISICLCMACRIAGAGEILKAIEQELGIEAGQTTKDQKFRLDTDTRSCCSGSAPIVAFDQEIYTEMTPEKAKEIILKFK
jgi:NADH:ubiquinone oxidoreductase subunit E